MAYDGVTQSAQSRAPERQTQALIHVILLYLSINLHSLHPFAFVASKIDVRLARGLLIEVELYPAEGFRREGGVTEIRTVADSFLVVPFYQRHGHATASGKVGAHVAGIALGLLRADAGHVDFLDA